MLGACEIDAKNDVCIAPQRLRYRTDCRVLWCRSYTVRKPARNTKEMNVNAWPRAAIFAALHMQTLDWPTQNTGPTIGVNGMRSLRNHPDLAHLFAGGPR